MKCVRITEAAVNYDFKDWLIWTPPGLDSIAVPIQSWRWDARAMADGDTTTHIWTSVFSTPSSSIHPGNTKDFPFWRHRLQLYTTTRRE
jgi:hypothetical protein